MLWKTFSLLRVLALFFLFSLNPSRTAMASPPARDCSAATVYIGFPQAGSVVNGTVAVSGAASLGGADFQRYALEFSTAGLDSWVIIAVGRQPVNGGVLGVWNTNSLPDGNYSLRVRAIDRAAQYCEGFVSPIQVQKNSAPPPPPPTQPPAVQPTQSTANNNQNSNNNNQAASRVPTPFFQTTPPATFQPFATLAPLQPSDPPPAIVAATVAPISGIAINVPAQASTPELTPAAPFTSTVRNVGQSSLPFDLSSIGDSLGEAVAPLRTSFLLGVQLTAGLFILLGAIVFLRHNL